MITVLSSPFRRPVAYSLACGLVATTTGTTASLLFTGAARVAVWSALTLAISVMSGLAYDAVTDRIRGRAGPGP